MSSNDPNDIRHVKPLGDKYKTKTELMHFKEAYSSLGVMHLQLQRDFKSLQSQLEKAENWKDSDKISMDRMHKRIKELEEKLEKK